LDIIPLFIEKFNKKKLEISVIQTKKSDFIIIIQEK